MPAKCKVAEPALAREQKERNMERFLKMRCNREINQLFNTFCRSWKSGAKASLNLSTENRVVKATLELELGKLDDTPPDVTAATGGLLEAGARPVRRHRGPGAQARSRLRAARYQAAKATRAPPSTESIETSHTLDSLDNVSDESRKFKILQSPIEPEKRRSVTRLPREVNLYSFLNLDGEMFRRVID